MFAKSLTVLAIVCALLVLTGSVVPTAAASTLASLAGADAPTKSTAPYSGRLADAQGQIVGDGAYDFAFALYIDQIGGDPFWSETVDDVTVGGGDFSTSLGLVNPLPPALPNGGKVWLAVGVRSASESEFTMLEPRQPFAFEASMDAAASALTCPHDHFGEAWGGAGTGYGLIIENTGSGDGLRLFSRGTNYNDGALYAVNSASTGSGSGVYAESGFGAGVYAHSSWNDGVVGKADAPNKSGVYGEHSAAGYGVFGRSTAAFGLGAAGSAEGDADGSDDLGDLVLTGDRGEVFAFGPFFNLYTGQNFNIFLDNDNNDANGCMYVRNGLNAVVGSTCENGAKSAVLQTEDFGQRAVYTIESPEVWLEDFGAATLVDGAATVTLDPVFAQMVNTDVEYHVFLTPLGECNGLFVAEKGTAGFTVKELSGGVSNVSFDYRIAVKRIGLENLRMEQLGAADAGPLH